jgi:hypothetical protein
MLEYPYGERLLWLMGFDKQRNGSFEDQALAYMNEELNMIEVLLIEHNGTSDYIQKKIEDIKKQCEDTGPFTGEPVQDKK